MSYESILNFKKLILRMYQKFSSEEKSWTIYPTWGVNSHYYRGQYQLAYFKGTNRRLKVSDSKIITKLGLKFITPFAKENYD